MARPAPASPGWSRGEDTRAVSIDGEMKTRVQRDHLQHRPRRLRGAVDRAAGAVRAAVGAAQGQEPRRRHRDAEAQIGRISLAHPGPAPDDPDATGQRALRDRPAAAGPRSRWHRVPADRHRRLRAERGRAGTIRSTSSSPRSRRKAAAERAMDRVRDRFGRDAVVRGKLYRTRQGPRRSGTRQRPKNEEGKPK